MSREEFQAFKKGMESQGCGIENDFNYQFLVTINDALYKSINNKFDYKGEKSTKEFVINTSRKSLIGICEHYIAGLEEILKKTPKRKGGAQTTEGMMLDIESNVNYNLSSKASEGFAKMSKDALEDMSEKLIGIVEELQFFEEKKKGGQKEGQKR